jgi:5-methylthioadenosine/S-adenosylhomocysteine deaminase
MAKTFIKNGIVVTINDAFEVFWGGTVVLSGGLIEYCGEPGGAPKMSDGDTTIDADGCVVMPGLVDLHYHTAIGRGYGDWLPLWEFLDYAWYPFILNLDPETARAAALASYAESLKCGVTTVNDMFRFVPSLAQAANQIGIRAVLSNDVMNPEEGMDTVSTNRESLLHTDRGEAGLVEVYAGFEWLPKGSRELMEQIRALANEFATGIHIHLNESVTEVEDSVKRFGMGPTELAYEIGLLGPDVVAAHCVHLSDREISMMAETGTSLSHNPVSNAKLANCVARVPEWLAAGINVGLGHDAAECNNSRNLWEVMKFASIVHRASRQDPTLMPAKQILTMATLNGNKALHHGGGQLVQGKLADVIVVDMRTLGMTPLEPGNSDQVFSHLVYANNGSSVRGVFVGGEHVLADGQLVKVEEQAVVSEANDAFLTVLQRVNAAR